jgi:hypothetical protein
VSTDATSRTPVPRPPVEDFHRETVEEFLRALSPMGDAWMGDGTAWIFRGHADADWELKARAMREANAFKPFGIHGDTSDWSKRQPLLEEALMRFRRGLDDSGFVIPTKSPRIVSHEFTETTYTGDVAREAWPLMALAQHHGIPTPLLDWTRRGAVAAYFAASSALEPACAKATHLAVWCLDAGAYMGRDDIVRSKSGHLQVYVPPGGTNPNLRAQAGVFTYLVGEADPSIEGFVAKPHADSVPAPKLLRFTLPVGEAGKLLRILASDGVHGASMFPGADGIVRAMREEAQWDRPPPRTHRR